MTSATNVTPDQLSYQTEPELTPAFDVLNYGATPSPLVFSSPHSGSIYPQSFLAQSQLDPFTLRKSEDVGVDELFTPAAQLCSSPLLRAHFPRAFLDANREPYELDPRMFDGPLPHFVNTRSIRVSAGLGTIPRLVDEGKLIYNTPLPVREIDRRLTVFYMPYHRALHDLLHGAQHHWGTALLIDCHSMPSAQNARGDQAFKADVVLGDRYGTTCHPDMTSVLEMSLRHYGYKVERNKPYAGGFITQHYGAPRLGRHAIQIEINRALYMDEASLTLHAHRHELAQHLAHACAQLRAYFDGQCAYEAAE
jgi:N-formylglutamate amidohydrolase